MNKKIKKIIIFWAVLFVFFACTGSALALEIQYPSVLGIAGPTDQSTIADYGRYIFGIGMALAAATAVIAVAIGGINYLVSYGRGKFTSDAKDWIKAGVLGLLIIACSYTIAVTIYPPLVIFNFGNILAVPNTNPENSNPNDNLNSDTYQTIPIGKLTENLLSSTMSCYEFDPEGDPVDYATVDSSTNPITEDKPPNDPTFNPETYYSPEWYIPTYLAHDRIDCLQLLMDGAQKKAQMIAELSDQIIKLMQTCKCTAETCDSPCNDDGDGCDAYAGACPAGGGAGDGLCTGACSRQTCTQPGNTCCTQSEDTDDCCPEGVLDKIEHGDVEIGCGADNTTFNIQNKFNFAAAALSNVWPKINLKLIAAPGAAAPAAAAGGAGCCDVETTTYKGLDEFRCGDDADDGVWKYKQCTDIADIPEDKTHSKGTKQGQKKTLEEQIIVNGQKVTVINHEMWDQLSLLQQETYFEEKINTVKNAIQTDANELNQAKTQLGKCYLAVPYVDLLESVKTTDQTAEVVFTQDNYQDHNTDQTIDIAKYCNGFNYSNSSCLKKCNDMCPDNTSDAVALYQKCKSCDTNNTQQCQDDQEACMENAYSQRPCPYNKANPSQKFEDCISSCQSDCSDECDQKYLDCFDEYKVCDDQCDENSQCVIDNEDTCLFGAQGFVDCANNNTDQGNTAYCLNRAYLCKNGSDQFAGYADCLDNTKLPTSSGGACTQNSDCPSCESCGPNKTCAIDYSGSFLYDNPDCQKCPEPYDVPEKDTYCYKTPSSGNTAASNNTSCQELCPSTSKCPRASNCPNCECTHIDTTLTFSIPNQSNGGVNTPGDNAGEEGYSDTGNKVYGNQIVTAECNGFNYNDDPLTFYCEDSWWSQPDREGLNKVPIGSQRNCPAEQEVPVGQTVDGAENWASGIISTTNNEIQSIQNLIDLITRIGKAKKTDPIQDYCKCPAKFYNNKSICSSDCQFNQVWVPDPVNGGGAWQCSCDFVACQGSPCEQIIILLSEVWDDYRTLKINWMNFYTSLTTDARSDILKMLEYSRQTTSSCSVTQNNFGTLSNTIAGSQARLLDCTRAEDERIPSVMEGNATFNNHVIPNYCYGQALGKLFNTPLTDDWFCCNLQDTQKP